MTKFVVLDTETSGLFDFRLPADDPSQPRLASFAAVITDDDLAESSVIKRFIRPEGWSMQSCASAVNGLTDEYLSDVGVPLANVLDEFNQMIDDGYMFAAFNAQFDLKMMRGELRRLDRDDRFEDTLNVCLMRACTDICQIPKAKGAGFKFPKLSEACEHFGIVNDAEHDALGDARAAYGILLKLHEMDALPEPIVHYAKNRSAA